MNIKTLVICVVMIFGIVGGVYTFMQDIYSSGTGQTLNVPELQQFNKTLDRANSIDNAYQNITSISTNLDSTIGIITLIPQAIKIIIDFSILPFEVFGGVISIMSTSVGLPAWAVTFFIMLLTVIVLFAMFKAITGYDA